MYNDNIYNDNRFIEIEQCIHCEEELTFDEYEAMLDCKIKREDYICYQCWNK
jgi:hypothetical protein